MENYILLSKITDFNQLKLVWKPYSRKPRMYILFEGTSLSGKRIIDYVKYKNYNPETLYDYLYETLQKIPDTHTPGVSEKLNTELARIQSPARGFDLNYSIFKRYTDFIYQCSEKAIREIVKEENRLLSGHFRYFCPIIGCGNSFDRSIAPCKKCESVEEKFFMTEHFIHEYGGGYGDYKKFFQIYLRSPAHKEAFNELQMIRKPTFLRKK